MCNLNELLIFPIILEALLFKKVVTFNSLSANAFLVRDSLLSTFRAREKKSSHGRFLPSFLIFAAKAKFLKARKKRSVPSKKVLQIEI